MLSYDLAKQLKDAGFPQEWPDEYGDSQAQFYIHRLIDSVNSEIVGPVWIQADTVKDSGKDIRGNAFGRLFVEDGDAYIECKYPTFSELIEECGDKIDTIERESLGWKVYNIDDMDFSYGETIEEAVANLWLEVKQE